MSIDHHKLRQSIPSLHSLMLFEASARHLNFSNAAQELSITQPAVSHGIRQLEAALGQELFVRERRKLTLTSHGQRLFWAVSGSFASISDTIDSITGTDVRETAILSTSTVVATEWLLPKLPCFYQENPDLNLEIRSLDRDSELMSQGIDVHLRIGTGHWPGCKAIQLWPERIVPVCSPDYLRTHGPVASVAQMLDHQLIHYIDPYRLRVGWGDWFAHHGVAFSPSEARRLQVNDSLLAMRAAEGGQGIALGWETLIDDALRQHRLVRATPATMITGMDHYAVSMAAPGRQKLVTRICDWLHRQAKAQPPASP